MGVFCVLLLTPLLIQHMEIRRVDYQKKNKFALAFFFVLLTILVAFRHVSIGNDTRNYTLFFYNYLRLDWTQLSAEFTEIGYAYFCKFIALFTDEAQVFFLIVAVLVTLMIYPTYKRLCLDSSLTIVLFCTMSTFVMMFSGIRQMIAIGLGFVAYEFTRNKKLLLFVITVLVAISFHTSAVMLLFMYPVFNAKITKKWLYFVIPSLVVILIFNVQIFTYLSLFINRYTRFDTQISATTAYTMIFLFGIFVAFSFIIPDENRIDQETIGLRNFLLLSLVIQFFAPLHLLAMRLNYYYIIFIPLLLPKIIAYRSKQWNQVAIVGRHVMVVFFLVYFFFNAYTSSNNLNVFPYHFFWESVV